MKQQRDIKFYMNNPCEVIRKISGEFSEIKVYPKFLDDDISGSNWCSACMLGGAGGAHPSHTCDPYNEVIDYINESNSSMIVVVENRLLNDEPVEFNAWRKVRKSINEMSDLHARIKVDVAEKERKLKYLDQLLLDVGEEIYNAKISVDNEYTSLNKLIEMRNAEQDKLSSITDSIKIGSVSVSMSGGELRELIRAKIILSHLEDGGVDNWEWYSESMPERDIDDLVQEEIQSIRVKSI